MLFINNFGLFYANFAAHIPRACCLPQERAQRSRPRREPRDSNKTPRKLLNFKVKYSVSLLPQVAPHIEMQPPIELQEQKYMQSRQIK